MKIEEVRDHFIKARLDANPNRLTEQRLVEILMEKYPQESEFFIRRVSYYLDNDLNSDFSIFTKEVRRLDRAFGGRNILGTRKKENNFENIL